MQNRFLPVYGSKMHLHSGRLQLYAARQERFAAEKEESGAEREPMVHTNPIGLTTGLFLLASVIFNFNGLYFFIHSPTRFFPVWGYLLSTLAAIAILVYFTIFINIK